MVNSAAPASSVPVSFHSTTEGKTTAFRQDFSSKKNGHLCSIPSLFAELQVCYYSLGTYRRDKGMHSPSRSRFCERDCLYQGVFDCLPFFKKYFHSAFTFVKLGK